MENTVMSSSKGTHTHSKSRMSYCGRRGFCYAGHGIRIVIGTMNKTEVMNELMQFGKKKYSAFPRGGG
jgi:hypothetical protein